MEDYILLISIILSGLSLLISISILALTLGIIRGRISLRNIKKLEDIKLSKDELEELQRQDRIKNLGELTASIVHDIGNPLAGMGNLVEILKDEDYAFEVKKDVLELMGKEIEDLNNLIINYLDFSRESKLDKEKINIIQLIEDVEKILKYELNNKEINFKIEDLSGQGLSPVYIDRRAIKQAFINIFKNSIEALEEGGSIDVRLGEEKNYLTISIRDSGHGIGKEEIENIFNPFYTTKKDGTGLGLSTVYKTILEHEGDIRVKSELLKGTEFTIKLPLARDK